MNKKRERKREREKRDKEIKKVRVTEE